MSTTAFNQSQPRIYDRPIGLRVLCENPVFGAEHYLVEYPPQLQAQRHRHSVAHTIVVVAGQLAVKGADDRAR